MDQLQLQSAQRCSAVVMGRLVVWYGAPVPPVQLEMALFLTYTECPHTFMNAMTSSEQRPSAESDRSRPPHPRGQ